MPTALVTGASGFIGQAVCRRLLASGWQVRGIGRDNAPPAMMQGVTWFQHDLASTASLATALEGVDALVHLAARVHIMRETKTDALALHRRDNRDATIRLGAAAVSAGVRRIIFSSTVKVLGESSHGHPLTETDAPQPEDAYAISKLEAENALREITTRDTTLTVLRIPLVYGPDVKGNFLRLLRLVDRALPLPFASIQNHRSLIFVENLADAIRTCLDHPAAAGQTFLVSDGDDLSTPELLTRIARFLDRPSRLWAFPPAALRMLASLAGMGGEMTRLVNSFEVSSGKIRSLLAWQPPFTLDQGLAQTVSWYRTMSRREN